MLEEYVATHLPQMAFPFLAHTMANGSLVSLQKEHLTSFTFDAFLSLSVPMRRRQGLGTAVCGKSDNFFDTKTTTVVHAYSPITARNES